MEEKIPKKIDDPLKLLIWDVRDVVPMVVCIILAILTTRMMLFLALGFAISYGSRKFRDRRQDGWGIHALYWIGLWPSEKLPNPFVRRYLP